MLKFKTLRESRINHETPRLQFLPLKNKGLNFSLKKKKKKKKKKILKWKIFLNFAIILFSNDKKNKKFK